MGFRSTGGGLAGTGLLTGPPSESIDIGDDPRQGISDRVALIDHQHPFPAPAVDPADLAAAPDRGTSSMPARANHKHRHLEADHAPGAFADLSGLYATIGTAALTALGLEAADGPPVGAGLTAIGYRALTSATTAEESVAVGARALEATTTGRRNVAVGYTALTANTGGSNNVAVGWIALQGNTTGGSNTACGDKALSKNTTGSNNVAVGRECLRTTGVGNGNVGVGVMALYSSRGGDRNTAVGTMALTGAVDEVAAASDGVNTATFAGAGVLDVVSTAGFLATGELFVFVGFNICRITYTGVTATAFTGCTSFGVDGVLTAGASVCQSTGSFNTAVGYQALNAVTSGIGNTAIGYDAGVTATVANATTTASRQTLVGMEAGQRTATQRDNVVAIGYRAHVDGDNAIAIGHDALAGAAGAVAIGRDSAGTPASTTVPDEIKLGTAKHVINVLGRLKWGSAGKEQTTVGAAGAAATLPLAPTKYLQVIDSTGAVLVIPAYTS